MSIVYIVYKLNFQIDFEIIIIPVLSSDPTVPASEEV